MKVRALRSLRGATTLAASTYKPKTGLDVIVPGPAGEKVSDVIRMRIEIEALERLGLDELRLRWRNQWGRLAPAHLTRVVLFRLMAYRIQADAFGDLNRQTVTALSKLAKRDVEISTSERVTVHGASSTPAAPASKDRRSRLARVLKPGAVMTREWQGRIERVMALEKGFAWNGKTFGSLSGVAFAITGVKWNGHRFFFGANRNDGGDQSGNSVQANPKPKPKPKPGRDVPGHGESQQRRSMNARVAP